MKRARLPAIFGFTLALLSRFGSPQAALAAGPDPAAEAQSLLSKLDAPETRALVKAPVEKAKAAQQRAQNARSSGDLQHATELDTLALTWAKVADDLVRTAESEKKLSEVQRAVAELDQKAVRTQALIEQTIARRGRAELNLKNAAGAPTTSTAGKGESQKPAKESGKSAPTKSQVKPSQPGVKQ